MDTLTRRILLGWTTCMALAAAGTAGAEVVATKSGNVNVETLAKLDNGWGMTFLPDGRLLVTEKAGRLRIFADGKLSEPVAGVPKVDHYQQGGLLDVEIDPAFARNHLVYLSYSEAAPEQPPDAKAEHDPRFGDFFDPKDNTLKGAAVARGRLEGNALKDVKVIWRQEPFMIGRGHFGGRLVFAPDGKLFILSGDRMRFEPAQELSGNLGKVVRINPDGSIPGDNPFVKQQGAHPDIWSMGHRNPLGGAIHPNTRELWIHEMGAKGGDELNIIEKGGNYGWPIVSEGEHYSNAQIPEHDTSKKFIPPIKAWVPSISPSGMAFYTGKLFPDWNGNLFIGGLSSQALIRLTLDGKKVTGEERIDLGKKRIRDVIQAPDGALLVITDRDSELLRITPAKQTS